ncbi:MAG TPA: SCO family protein [Gemmatimonadales bacterium]|nr:SCO family protein [Gemmatimonadales bacterium]
MRFRALAVALGLGLLAACSGGGGGAEKAKASTPAGRYHGATLTPPLPQPDFTLTTTDGKPFHFKAETQGYVSLLFFGYTHCPDVCPVHMANLASVLDRLPVGTAGSIKVIFVTVDPARDTPRELRKWLDHFRPSFIGLWGSLAEVNQVQSRFGMPATEIEKLPDGSYAVGHGAAVIASVGDSVRVLYPFGVRQADWLEDLPRLVAAIPREHKAD